MCSDESELAPESIEETVKVSSTVHTPKNQKVEFNTDELYE